MNQGLVTYPNGLGKQTLFSNVRAPIFVTSNQFITANNHYVITSSTTLTLTLPLNPISGNILYLTNASNNFSHIINRNNNRIQGLAENLILDVAYRTTQLKYVDATTGWIVN